MRKILLAAVGLLCAAASAQAQSANYLQIQASHIVDATGTTLSSGAITFQATDSNNVPISFQPGSGGATVRTPVTASIVSGVITTPNPFLVANPASTSPVNIKYHIQIKQGPRVVADFPLVNLCTQGTVCSSGYVFNFDLCISSGACPQAPMPIPFVPEVGPQGPAGAGTGAINTSTAGNTGCYSSGTTISGCGSALRYADSFSGINASAKINSCIAAVVALGGGICDASGLYGAQTSSSEIDIPAGVVLLGPASATWSVSISDGTSCGIKQFSGSGILGRNTITGTGAVWQIVPTNASTNVRALYCTDPSPSGGGSYVRAEGFNLYNAVGATMVKGLMDVEQLYDNSVFRDINVDEYTANQTGIFIYHTCCAVTWINVTSNSNSTGGRPVWLFADDNGYNYGNAFYNLSADHAGSGYGNVEITGTHSSPPTNGTNRANAFYSPWIEFGSSGTTYGFKIVDARGVHIENPTVFMTSDSNVTAIDISQTTAYQVRDIDISGLYYEGSAGMAISNHITGETYSSSTGYLPSYIYGGTSGGAVTQPVFQKVVTDVDQYWRNASNYSVYSWPIAGGALFGDGLGHTIYSWPTSGSASITNQADAQLLFTLNAGATSAQDALFWLQDRGTTKWQFGKFSGGAFAIQEYGLISRLYIAPGGSTDLNAAGGANAVHFNNTANSGTGGVQFLSGGASPTITASITSNGIITGNYFATGTDCAVNSASPAACGAAAAGAFVVPTTTATYTINTSAVTSHSRIFLQPITFASDLPSSPTCVAPLLTTEYSISAVSNGTSFTMALTSTTGQTCWMYHIIN